MGGIFFYTGAISFLLGVALATVWPQPLSVSVWLVMLSFVIALIKERTTPEHLHTKRPIQLLCIGLLCVGLGLLRIEVASWSASPIAYESRVGEEVILSGVIVREPDVRERTQHLYTEVDNELLLVITDRFGEFSYGDRIEVNGELERPASFETDLGRTFNYPGYLKAQGVEYLIRYGEIAVVDQAQGHIVLAALLSFKQRFMDTIEMVIPEPQVGLAEGLLLGVKRALGEEYTEIFRRTGIIHIVVLSGYNVALVVAFVMYGLALFLPLKGRAVVGVLAIVSFALMVGLSATVLRASIMAALILAAQVTGRIYLITRALLFTAVIMVLINPYILVYDPGFQLSFLATLGLIIGAPWLEEKLSFVSNMFSIRGFLTATVVTQIFVLPFLLYQIGEFSVVSVLVNVLVLPMVPVAMLLTFLTGLVGFVSTALATPLAFLTSLSLTYILVIAEWFAALPFAAFVVPAFPFWLVPIAYALLGYLFWRLLRTSPGLPSVQLEPELANWTIVEEATLKAGDSRRESPAKELPVFFR